MVNCAAETRPGQTEAVYEEGITKVSLNCARQVAALANSDVRFVELSSGNMLSSDKKPVAEDCTPSPWTMEARFKAKLEQQLPQIKGLSYTIVRLPLVYGKGDRRGLSKKNANTNYFNDSLKYEFVSASHYDCGHLQVSGRHNEIAVEQQDETEHGAC